MHKLEIKQPHESLLLLLRYRTNGHNASVFYCMGQTAIVYITVDILITARKTGGLGWDTPNENWPYVAANENWLYIKYRHYHCDRKPKMHINSGVIKSRFKHESMCEYIMVYRIKDER